MSIPQKRVLFLVGLAYALFLAFIIMVGVAETNARHKREQELHDTWDYAAGYAAGFADGMNATLRHVKLATNVVELAPILDEMKQ